MLINEIKPSLFLSEYVRLYRIIDFHFTNITLIPFKAYPPTPEHCLQFMAGDLETIKYPDSELLTSSKPVIFMGPHTNVIHRFPGKRTLGLQVIFQPGAIHQITNISSSELTDLYMDAENLFGNCTRLVNEQLFHSQNYSEMIEIVEQFLTPLVKRRMQKSHPVDEISKAMI